jgi:hypothetical protein
VNLSPAVEAGELALLDPEVRASAARTAALLHPGFTEFGRSGRRWGRESIVTLLAAEGEPAPDTGVTVSELRGVPLAPDLVHLTFITERGGSRTNRSSLWRRTEDGWQLWFHQGTPTEEPST